MQQVRESVDTGVMLPCGYALLYCIAFQPERLLPLASSPEIIPDILQDLSCCLIDSVDLYISIS